MQTGFIKSILNGWLLLVIAFTPAYSADNNPGQKSNTPPSSIATNDPIPNSSIPSPPSHNDHPGPDNQNLIKDTATLRQIRLGVDHIYNNDFEKAELALQLLRQEYEYHPMTSFYEGLILYWKYYPLVIGHPGSEEFERAMQLTWERADSLKQLGSKEQPKGKTQNQSNDPHPNKDPQSKTQQSSPRYSANEIEGVFFEMVSRGFIVMNQADNGKSSGAIVHFNRIYRDILMGMAMEEQFREFMFMTGLYNYYREAFPEAYPVYKVALVFFRRGDKVGGLSTLRRATTETDFMRVEATLFLSLIQINFENNPDSSLYYTSLLHKTYPGNAYFHAKFTEMLLINEEYEQAGREIEELMKGDSYNRMKATIYRGMYEEKHKRNLESAGKLYEKGLILSEPFNERATYTKAYAYIGLSRYYKARDDNKKAREYYKKASNASGYEYVFK